MEFIVETDFYMSLAFRMLKVTAYVTIIPVSWNLEALE